MRAFVVWGRMPGDAADAFYMHVTHDNPAGSPSSFLKRSAGIWNETSFLSPSSAVRPGLAYVPSATDSSKGKLYVAFPDAASQAFLIQSTVTRVDQSTVPPTLRPALDSHHVFDNVWSTGRGVSLLYQPGYDTNLRAAIVYDFHEWKDKPVFQPLADGITDTTYGSFNDWDMIGQYACRAVANPGARVTNPMPCF